MRLYGAYGSNLCVDQMAYRCPTAKLYGAGWLSGHRLTFQGTPGNAYANIVRQEGGQVPVLVWQVQPSDEKALDRYEGYPQLYTKETVSVSLESGDSVDVMVYVMTNMRPHLGIPSRQYYQCVEAGYREAGFSLEPMVEALAESLGSERNAASKAGGQNG